MTLCPPSFQKPPSTQAMKEEAFLRRRFSLCPPSSTPQKIDPRKLTRNLLFSGENDLYPLPPGQCPRPAQLRHPSAPATGPGEVIGGLPPLAGVLGRLVRGEAVWCGGPKLASTDGPPSPSPGSGWVTRGQLQDLSGARLLLCEMEV